MARCHRHSYGHGLIKLFAILLLDILRLCVSKALEGILHVWYLLVFSHGNWLVRLMLHQEPWFGFILGFVLIVDELVHLVADHIAHLLLFLVYLDFDLSSQFLLLKSV